MIIGISGLAGSGKDTIADMFIKHGNIVKISLADPIKRICRDLWDFSLDQLWGPSEMRNQEDSRYPLPDGSCLSARKALQLLGTEGLREIDNNVHIRYLIRTANKLTNEIGYSYTKENGLFSLPLNKTLFVVVPDIRFSNELNNIKQFGGKIIRVKRPNSGLKGNLAKHKSEVELINIKDKEFDFVINNDGTLLDLEEKISPIISRLIKEYR